MTTSLSNERILAILLPPLTESHQLLGKERQFGVVVKVLAYKPGHCKF